MVYPQFDSNWVSLLCTAGPRPLITTGWLRLWLTGHFQLANLEDQSQAVQHMLWTPVSTTGIMIESITRWLPEMTEKRPAVIIKRNPWKRIRLGIGDKMLGLTELDGQGVYANAWQGSHTLFCITGKGAETELLAAEVYREMNEFGPVFREVLDLLRFEVSEVGDLMILDEARQNFVVPIVVAYAFVEGWRIRREVPVLKTASVTLLTP
jgi:hypothetical protein